MQNQKRVLIIEDESDLADILRQGLTEAGYAVDVAYDGVEGLRKAASGGSDLIILDMKLPGLDGLSVLSSLRKQNIETPALMLTAWEDLMDGRKKAGTDADDFMTKPFRFDELLSRISRLLSLKSREELNYYDRKDLKERLEKLLS